MNPIVDQQRDSELQGDHSPNRKHFFDSETQTRVSLNMIDRVLILETNETFRSERRWWIGFAGLLISVIVGLFGYLLASL